MKSTKKVLLDNLRGHDHPVPVEDVIYWALHLYSQRGENTVGEMVAHAIIQEIHSTEEEKEGILILPKEAK